MKVIKRDGSLEDVSFDKVLRRIKCLCEDTIIDPVVIAQKVCNRIYDGVKTSELDEFASNLCISMITDHPDYGKLASKIIISNNHKKTSPSFTETMTMLFNNVDSCGDSSPIIGDKLYNFCMKHKNKLNNYIKYERDYLIDYFGFKTLEKSYLSKIDGTIVERPQHMWMRVSIGIHGRNMKDILETYNFMSQKYFTHATPTLFNAGTPRPQMSSCYLLGTEDSIEGIFKTITDCGRISKYAGGIGIHISNIRATGSRIRGTNGNSDGIIPMLKVYNETARYVNQSGRRKGSIAVYLEPWHADIEAFLDLKKNHGDENQRARDLFTALWIPDLFMERVRDDGMWSLFCPDQCPKLHETYGEEFNHNYRKYETDGNALRCVKARDLWYSIMTSQIETGTPYLLYKDACNKKSNQKNVGIIKSSNLCAEIIEYSDTENYAVCNLASIALNMFVKEDKTYDFQKLYEISKIITKNLNKVIDANFYPTSETKKSNMNLRPIALGVQGLADTFFKMRYPFDSDEAKELNKRIFETIYFGAAETSCELSKKYGSYNLFEGSPVSKGQLQFDMWGVTPSGMWDWGKLKGDIKEFGMRNSLLTALMPTASTSQILGNFECFECITSNLYVRRTLAGEFIVVNKYLINDLVELGLWNKELKEDIIRNDGSIQDISIIPDDIKTLYKTVWEISQKHIIDMSVDRAAYVDQSQSMNLFMSNPSFDKLTSMHFYAWSKGLKTGMYYLRTRAKSSAQKFTIAQKNLCSIQNREDCEMCSG